MELYGKIIKLRAVEHEDLEMLRELTNDPDFEKMILGWAFPISKSEQEKWFLKLENDTARLRYIIETPDEGAVGMIGLRNIDWKNGTAHGLGMRIAKTENRKKGLATDAWMTLLKYAFEELRMNRVETDALEYNKASLRVLEKVGFIVEGKKRQYIYKNGEYHDVIILGCLKSDYYNHLDQNKYWDI